MKTSIRNKLIIFAFIILAGNLLIGYAIYNTNQKRIKSEQLVQHTEDIISNLGNILLLGKDIESASRGFIITNDSAFLEPLFTAEKIIFNNIRQLRQQFKGNSAQQQRVDSIHYNMQKRLAFSLQQAELRSNQGLLAAIAYASTNRGLYYSDNLRQIIAAIEQQEDTNLKQLQQVNEYSITTFNWISRIMFVLISVITILLLIVTGKNLQQNEKREKRAAELIIANEELVFQIQEKGKRAAEFVIVNKELVFQNEEKEKQEAANKELEAFSYSVSHDLQAPLRHIGGFVDLLIKNNSSQLDEKGIRYLKIISESSHEMGNLIDALLTFSRLSRTELLKTKINSQNMVAQVLKSFSDEMAGRDVEINVSELPDAIGDETLIHQVWENLVSNALKYSKNKEKAMISIGSEIVDNKTVFFIRDNGAGIDMKYADKLFGVFQRMHKATEFEGIGIGLANVNRIVVRHGGKCWAESEVGNGATFFFSLPNEEVFSRSD